MEGRVPGPPLDWAKIRQDQQGRKTQYRSDRRPDAANLIGCHLEKSRIRSGFFYGILVLLQGMLCVCLTPHPALQCGKYTLKLDTPKIMAIVNVTPDSFSDGGRSGSPLSKPSILRCGPSSKVRTCLDIGGESTRPNAMPVSIDEELSRVIPVIEALAASSRGADQHRHLKARGDARRCGRRRRASSTMSMPCATKAHWKPLPSWACRYA